MTVKSRLLEILEKEKGETLSGEKLAEELHCTRAGCRNLPECDPRTERQSSGESASDCRGGSGSLQSSKENYRS